MPPPDTHNIVHATTPEAAEAVAYSDPSGIHRLATPGELMPADSGFRIQLLRLMDSYSDPSGIHRPATPGEHI
jgi:hypothetical protein